MGIGIDYGTAYDKNGNYSIEEVRRAKYLVHVGCFGYSGLDIKIEFLEDMIVQATLQKIPGNQPRLLQDYPSLCSHAAKKQFSQYVKTGNR